MLPKGMFYQLGGLYRQQQQAFRGLTIVMLAAIALVFTLLLFLYESFRVALTIMAMPLLALPAVFAGLWLTGIELNISSMMRSEEHTSELQSLMRISYAVFCLKKQI